MNLACQKWLGNCTKVLGNGVTPPLWEKFPKNTVFFGTHPLWVMDLNSKSHIQQFSPRCVFKCFLKMSAWIDVKLHWSHMFDFSSLCVFKCLLKLSAWIDVKLHWSQLLIFLYCAFSNGSSNWISKTNWQASKKNLHDFAPVQIVD